MTVAYPIAVVNDERVGSVSVMDVGVEVELRPSLMTRGLAVSWLCC